MGIKDILVCVGRRRNRHNAPDPERVMEFIRKVINVSRVAKCVQQYGDSCQSNANEPWEWAMCVKFSCARDKWDEQIHDNDITEEVDDEEDEEFNTIEF